MIFSISSKQIHLSLGFGLDSVYLTAKRSHPRNDNKFPTNSSASLEIFVVPKTRVSGHFFGPNPNHSQAERQA